MSRTFRFALVVCLLAVMAASCSSDEGVGASTTSAAAVTTTSSTTTTQVPPSTTAAPTTTTTTLPVPCIVSEPAPAEEAGEPGRLIEGINDRGMVRVGVLSFDAPPLFSCVEGEYVGFEATLIRLIVEAAIGPIEIAWVPLSSADRFDAVRHGGVDFVLRNTTVTPDREDLVDFTTPYLMDGPAVIVPTGAEVGNIAGLEGLRIAVVEGSKFEADLIRLLGEAGIVFDLVPAQSPDEFMTLLEDGEADAYAAGWLQGVTAATQDQNLVVIPLEFNQGIAAFTSPSESEFGAAIAEQMQTLIDNGAWATEFPVSFTFSPPWTIEEMAASG
jgi:ABC-type amino acid transport substrate-binding protein